MFERFTTQARRAVVLAMDQARLLGRDSIGTEHLLLGVVQQEDEIGDRVFAALDVTLGRAQEAVVETTGRGASDQTASARSIPFTPGAKRVLERSLREAMQLGHNHIGTEHIILGLLDASDDALVRVLARLGVEVDAARARVLALLDDEPPPLGVPPPGVLSPGVLSPVVPPAASWSRLALTASAAPFAFSPNQCSFCGRDLWEVEHYVTGSSAVLCDACLAAATTAVEEARRTAGPRYVALPPRVFGDEPPPGAVDAIVATIGRVFGPTDDPVPQPDWIEDGAALAPLFAEVQRRHSGVAVSVQVERIRFESPSRAQVRIAAMLLGGLAPTIEGALILRGGRWIVSRELMARVLTVAGMPPPFRPR